MPKLAIISKNLLCQFTMTRTVDRTSRANIFRAECGVKKKKSLIQAEPVFSANIDPALYASLYDYHGRAQEEGERIEVPKSIKDIEDGYIGPLNFNVEQAVLNTLNSSLTTIAGRPSGDLALNLKGDYFGQYKIYRAYTTIKARVFIAVPLAAMAEEKSYTALLEKAKSAFQGKATFLIGSAIVNRSGVEEAETVIVRKLPGNQARFHIDAGYIELTLQTDWVDESELIPCDIQKAESGEHKKKTTTRQAQSFGAIIEDKSPSYSYQEDDADETEFDLDEGDEILFDDTIENEIPPDERSKIDRAEEILEESENVSQEIAPLAQITEEVIAVFEKEVIAGNITQDNAPEYLISGVKEFPIEGQLSLLPVLIAGFKSTFAESKDEPIRQLADITVTAAIDYMADLEFGFEPGETDSEVD